jgi:ABC-2 type transport system permease protein
VKSQIIHLLRFKILSGIKIKLDFQPHTVVKNLASIIVFGGFAVGAYFFAAAVTGYLMDEVRIGSFLLHRFLSIALFVFFATICLGNILVSYSTLFRSPEVRFYLTLPVAYYKIFIIKFLENFFYSSATFFLMGFAVIAGYGSYFGYPWYFYPAMMFLVFIPFMFIAACTAVIILLGVMRLAAIVRIHRLIGIFAVGYISVIYIFFKNVSPVSLVANILEKLPDMDYNFAIFDPWFLRFLPNHWVSELLFRLSYENYAGALQNLIFIGVATLGIFTLAILAGRKHYYKAWLASLDMSGGGRKIKRNSLSRAVAMQRSGIVGRQAEVLIKRDILRFFRDPGQWLHLSVMVLLVIVFIISVGGMKVEFKDPFLMLVVFLVIFLFNAFLISAMSLRFVYPMTSLEGESLWVIRSAPLNVRKLYVLKAVIALSVLMTFAQLLTMITTTSLFNNIYLLTFSIAAQSVIVVTLISMNLGLGSYFALYTEKNPIRIASSQGASLTFLLSLVYLIVVVAAIMPSLLKFFEHTLFGLTPSTTLMFIPLAVVVSFSFCIAVISTMMGISALRRDV